MLSTVVVWNCPLQLAAHLSDLDRDGNLPGTASSGASF
jgi:hypothetical protein